MTIIDSVRAWLGEFPGLANERINVDFLPEEAQTYSVDSVPAQEIVNRYLDGSTVRQFLFVVSSLEFLGEDLAQNIDNHAFYEALSQWLEEQNKLRSFPDLGDRRRVRSVEINSTAYPFVINDDGTARYQIQMKMMYYQRG